MYETRDFNWKPTLYLIGAIGLAFGMSFLIRDAEGADFKKMQTQAFEPSVQIGKFCSGTIIYSDRDKKTGDVSTAILSAKHCFKRSYSSGDRVIVNVANYDETLRKVSETSYLAELEGSSYKSDLSLLTLLDKDKIFPTATVAPEGTEKEVKFADEVVSVSFPMGMSKTFTMGHLGYIENLDGVFSDLSDSDQFYRSTPAVDGGSSGSGLFRQNAKGDYELIGVLTGSATANDFVNLYTPLDEINEYLKTAKKVYEVNVE